MAKSDRGARISLNRSLRLRVTLATGLAFVGLGIVVCLVLPRAYAEQTRESLRERTHILAHGVAYLMKGRPVSEENGEGAGDLKSVAGWLDAEPDFESAIVMDRFGQVIGGWPVASPKWSADISPTARVIEGADYFVGVVPVAGSGPAVAIAVRTSTVRMAADLENMRWLFAAIFVFTCVAFWVLSSYLVRGIVEPLEDVRQAAMALADGEPIVDMPLSGDREIDELGQYVEELGHKRRKSTLMASPLVSYLREKSPLAKGGPTDVEAPAVRSDKPGLG